MKYLGWLIVILTPWYSAQAIPPPDIILSTLQSVLQVLGVITAFLTIMIFNAFKDQF
ncbi:hypothetical protein GW756_01950 [bacterium]|nr:hypothetical protein [bacterium]NCQ55556.1 hypothetical protein [Candidatus Parcubacteria bacterium]NCS67381.1 hypothetical protein [Candidatus Peregrinibacteria bacterium]NCS96107.1 hypothetical protein [bacterium]